MITLMEIIELSLHKSATSFELILLIHSSGKSFSLQISFPLHLIN